MRLGVIRTRRDVIRFVVNVTIIGLLVATSSTYVILNVFKPETQWAYLLNASLIVLLFVPLMAGIVASNIVYVQKMRDQLAEQASLDPLTSLMNRRGFIEKVSSEQLRMERTGAAAALILVDLDHFKHVNDVHGHLAGDMVLQAVAEVLRSNVRPSMDFVARWGGEEFVLMLTGTDVEGASIAADRLRGKLEKLDPSIGKVCLAITASFGVAPLRFGQTLDDAIDHADRCLYQAKNSGRNKVVSEKPENLRVVA